MLPAIAVVVGGGQAGGQIVTGLRQAGFDGRVVLIASEPHPPYQRPPLSKAFLAGELPQARLSIRDRHAYGQSEVELRTGVTVTAVRFADRTVRLDDGDRVGFDHLVFATGSRPRLLGVVGAEHPRLFQLRTIEHAQAIRSHFQPGARLVVIGGGYLGLEVAATARTKGLQVTVLEGAPQLLARVTGPAVGGFYRELHRQQGVDVRCGVAIAGIEGDPDHPVVVTDAGERFEADLVIAAVGAVPNVEVARDAGLVCNHGIVVDELCRSSVPDVYAAGDCAEQAGEHEGHGRLESVPNALQQARIVAAAICGKPRPPRQVPWFWSDQYDVKLQSAGLVRGHEQVVVRGEPDRRSFAVYYLRGERLQAVDALNRPAEFSLAKAWIAERKMVRVERLEDDRIAPSDITA